MPRLLDTNVRTDELAHVLARLISEEGMKAPSSRKVAAGMRMSIGTLAHHFESRQRLLRVLSHRIGRELMDATAPYLSVDGPSALLPTDEDGIRLTRAWLGVVELARSSEHVGHSVADITRSEQSHLIIATKHRLRDERSLDSLQALLHGLRAATCRYVEPLDLRVARRMLNRHADHLIAGGDADAA